MTWYARRRGANVQTMKTVEHSFIQLCDEFSAFSTVYANAIVFRFCIILFRIARHVVILLLLRCLSVRFAWFMALPSPPPVVFCHHPANQAKNQPDVFRVNCNTYRGCSATRVEIVQRSFVRWLCSSLGSARHERIRVRARNINQ